MASVTSGRNGGWTEIKDSGMLQAKNMKESPDFCKINANTNIQKINSL